MDYPETELTFTITETCRTCTKYSTDEKLINIFNEFEDEEIQEEHQELTPIQLIEEFVIKNLKVNFINYKASLTNANTKTINCLFLD